MSRCLFQKARNVGDPVLAVRIDLQDVAVARLRRVASARQHGAAFAAIDRMANQDHSFRRGGDQSVEHAGTFMPAAVVDDDARQFLRQHALNHAAIACS